MTYTYTPRGVCSRKMTVELENGVIKSVSVEGGCNGNLQGISRLVVGMNAQDAIERMKGIHCGPKPTSCPDQMAHALEEALAAITSSAAEIAGLSKRVGTLTPGKDADVVVTAVWNTVRPGTQDSEQRLRDFAGYQLTSSLLAAAKPDHMVLHCLPAHRGEEISTAVFEGHADEIFDEAENRLHVQKAVLAILLGGKPLRNVRFPAEAA